MSILAYRNETLAFWASMLGAVLSTVATVPQANKIRRGRSTKDLHLLTFAIHFVSAMIWAFYGFLIKGWVLFFECIIVGLLNLYICIRILKDSLNEEPSTRNSLSNNIVPETHK